MRLHLLLWIGGLLGATAGGETIDFGFEQRVRNEIWDNVFDYNDASADARTQMRYRTRIWSKIPVAQTIDAFVALNQESCQWLSPKTPFHFDEVIVENAYVDFKRLFKDGLSLRVGRQNLARGEGFVLFEGGPWDGSRSIYFNAAALSYAWRKNRLELLAISNPARDRYLPRWHGTNRQLVEWDERAAGLYGTFGESVEAYYFYKTEKSATVDRSIQTAGLRSSRTLGRGVRGVAEWAAQWGSAERRDVIRANGGYVRLTKELDVRWKPALTGGYLRLSGDDPTTSTREGWDPLFSRWPKWSDLSLYSQVRENGVGYATNMTMWQAEIAANPAKRALCRFTVYRLGAPHSFAGNPAIFGSGRTRGNNYQARVDIVASSNWRGHLVYEALAPGSFYQARSQAHFFRWEVLYQIQASAHLPALLR